MEHKMAAYKEVMDFGFELKKESVKEDGYFEGYASTFGGEPDKGGDVVAKGCFAETLKKSGGGAAVAMLWSHDPRQPIGVWHHFEEDEKGLFCKGQVHPDAQPEGIPIHGIMRMGGIKGLSIGYKAVEATRDEKKGVRTLHKVDLLEVSPVTFPMNTRASVTHVKGIFEARTARQLERALRDAEIPADAAKYLVTLCAHGLRDAGGTGGHEMETMLAELRNVNKALNADLTAAAFRHAMQ